MSPRNIDPTVVECPYCGSFVGQNCQRFNGVEPGRSCPTHKARTDLARTAAMFCLRRGMVADEFCVKAKGHDDGEGHICRPQSQWPSRPVGP